MFIKDRVQWLNMHNRYSFLDIAQDRLLPTVEILDRNHQWHTVSLSKDSQSEVMKIAQVLKWLLCPIDCVKMH